MFFCFLFAVTTFAQTFNELSAREVIDPGDLSPLQTQLEELESALMDLEMYQVSWLSSFAGWCAVDIVETYFYIL